MPNKFSDDRRLRFHSRIATEREILTIVNSSTLCQGLPLAGMTAAAISEWEIRAQGVLEPGKASAIVEFLLEIGKRTELLTDDSRDVFGVNNLSPHDRAVDVAKAALIRLVSQSVSSA